ncbi:uncharacterized protein LOC127174556 [Labeo rohita]|uniref:uncharacterized protein LOC127174556 n=1 Tax=Labeo rohita TaxID=84645 RepID=UPI0021E2DD60|nr:uncharacterized protein LOC127174556 [Labeo rohita]
MNDDLMLSDDRRRTPTFWFYPCLRHHETVSGFTTSAGVHISPVTHQGTNNNGPNNIYINNTYNNNSCTDNNTNNCTYNNTCTNNNNKCTNNNNSCTGNNTNNNICINNTTYNTINCTNNNSKCNNNNNCPNNNTYNNNSCTGNSTNNNICINNKTYNTISCTNNNNKCNNNNNCPDNNTYNNNSCTYNNKCTNNNTFNNNSCTGNNTNNNICTNNTTYNTINCNNNNNKCNNNCPNNSTYNIDSCTATTTNATTTSPTTPPTTTPTTTLAGITATTTTTKSLTDPCYKYTVLDDPWRSPDYPYSPQSLMCDYYVNWVGWYRLFINGQSAQMSETCVNELSCSTHAPMWLNGTHPKVEDGVVSRNVCGHWENKCCRFQSNPIKVKACPGGYYVYEFVKPNYCSGTYCAAPKIFYPFGSAVGDTRNPAAEDGSSSVIQLLSPFLFFGRTYQQIYVNNNGYLTFNQPSSAYTPYFFRTNGSQDIIAGLWTDLDNRVRGVVSYHQYTSGSVLSNTTKHINTYFPNLNFNASWVFVATWDKVAYFSLTNTDTSFQLVLISGSNYSFILMNYGDIAVTGHPVQAGYDTVNSTHYFVIPGSDSGSFISNLRNSSNVNVPGRWAFRVDSGPRNSILKNNVIGTQVRLSSFSDLTQSGNIEMVLEHMKQELVKYGLPNSVELKLRKLQKIKP